MDELVRYVVDNPVEEGYVADCREWPRLGGTLIDEG